MAECQRDTNTVNKHSITVQIQGMISGFNWMVSMPIFNYASSSQYQPIQQMSLTSGATVPGVTAGTRNGDFATRQFYNIDTAREFWYRPTQMGDYLLS